MIFESKWVIFFFLLLPVLATYFNGISKILIFLDRALSFLTKKPNFGLEKWKLKIFLGGRKKKILNLHVFVSKNEISTFSNFLSENTHVWVCNGVLTYFYMFWWWKLMKNSKKFRKKFLKNFEISRKNFFKIFFFKKFLHI